MLCYDQVLQIYRPPGTTIQTRTRFVYGGKKETNPKEMLKQRKFPVILHSVICYLVVQYNEVPFDWKWGVAMYCRGYLKFGK